MSNANEPASPSIEILELGKSQKVYHGLTKREAVAMHICVGVAAFDNERMADYIAKDAVDIADALLAELAREFS